jgi:hypothetical protein
MVLSISKDNQILYQIGKNPQEETDLASLEQLVMVSAGAIRARASPFGPTRISEYGTMEDVMAIMQKTNTITFSLVTELVASQKSAMRS